MKDWIRNFRGLSSLAPELQEVLTSQSNVINVPEGTRIFGPGKAPESLLLLLDGVVRVQQLAESGREIVLYRVHAMESCVLTTACLLAYEDYSAEGIAETDVMAVAVPKSVFEDMIARSPDFRRFVFTAYSRRITDLFMIIEEVAFRRVDLRLAGKLLELEDNYGQINLTHQQLATELGTAREVVSRQLQEFQRKGWIKSTRGHIDIIDQDELQSFAESS